MSPPRGTPVRAVLLDAAGTLIRVAAPVGDTYAVHARQFGGDASPGAIAAGFRRAFPAMPPLAFPGAADARELETLERAWWLRLVGRVFDDCGVRCDLDACFDALWSHYADAAAWRLYPEVAPVLAGLAARGVRAAVVSNFDSRLPPLLAALGIAGSFETIVCSGEAGAAKPDPAIFHRATAALGVSPGETLHVGDDPDADFAGARSAGLQALLVDRGGRNDDLGAGRITSLEGVLGWLDREA